MARPKKQGVDSFPHDVYACNDPRIVRMVEVYGSAGYAWYFLHLEHVYRGHKYCFDISSEETIDAICQKLKISQPGYGSMLLMALEIGLFDQDRYNLDGCLTSEGVMKQAQRMTRDRDRMRKAYQGKKG